MKKKLMMLVAAVAAAIGAWTGLAETVTNVRGMQREKSNLVDIYYDIEATDGGKYTVKVEIEGRTNAVSAASFTGDVGEGVTPGRNRHIVWNAGADWPDKKGDVRAVVTAVKKEKDDGKHKGVRLWEGGPYWATTNIGAENPEDYGYYFWWGDTVGYKREGNAWVATDGSSSNFQFYNDPISKQTYNKSVSTLQSEGWIVNENGTYVLAPEHDAAQVQWGGGWRMPTYQELYDLCYNKCDWTWTTQNGVNGYVVRGRGDYASNSIFLPCAGYGYGSSPLASGSYGYYWSSVPLSDYDYIYARGLYFYSGYLSMLSSYRYYGFSVRPVQGFAQ